MLSTICKLMTPFYVRTDLLLDKDQHELLLDI
jgi:hypothetical protein